MRRFESSRPSHGINHLGEVTDGNRPLGLPGYHSMISIAITTAIATRYV
jgi:hypothetical protein